MRGAGKDGYDGASPAGTTIDFRLRVECADPSQEVFSIQAGSGAGSQSIRFRPDAVLIGRTEYPHDATIADTYRIAFRDGKLFFYSARLGEIATLLPISTRHPLNAISLGTRPAITVGTSVVWELDFVHWSNQEARFVAPSPCSLKHAIAPRHFFHGVSGSPVR